MQKVLGMLKKGGVWSTHKVWLPRKSTKVPKRSEPFRIAVPRERCESRFSKRRRRATNLCMVWVLHSNIKFDKQTFANEYWKHRKTNRPLHLERLEGAYSTRYPVALSDILERCRGDEGKKEGRIVELDATN